MIFKSGQGRIENVLRTFEKYMGELEKGEAEINNEVAANERTMDELQSKVESLKATSVKANKLRYKIGELLSL